MTRLLVVVLLLWLQTTSAPPSPCLFWSESAAESASALRSAGIGRICVPPDRADAWRAAGVDVVPTTDADLAAREALPPPGIASRVDLVSSTRSPWVNANGWRFVRKPRGRYAYDLPAGSAALAAAEAAAYGADAVLKIDAADLPDLGKMLAFLRQLPSVDLPPVADLAVVDDGSAVVGEVMNLLARRNLLYQPVRTPSPQFPINVALGTKGYSRKDAKDPSAFALKIRRRLTDDQRTLRVYGSEVVIARLTGDAERRRLQLLNYGGREIDGLRIRLRGAYRVDGLRVSGVERAEPQDVAVANGATELSIPRMTVYAVVDFTVTR
jgi:hypothetical protein